MRSRRHAAPATTIADIGRELGLSAMTVSRALNGSAEVNQDTRERVLSTAARLNYRPNRWARSLVTRRSHIVGIIVPDISHSYFSEITRVVQEMLESRGYDLMLCHTHGSAEREKASVDMLLGSRVDGLIVASQRDEDDPGYYEQLLLDGTPFVLLDRFFPSLDCARVRADDRQVGLIATRHLTELGHTRIAHLRGPAVSVARLRLEGYREALREAELPYREEYVAGGDAFTIEAGIDAMNRLLALPERPTAVFATNDPAAIGAVRACREAGLTVPGDVSVVGAGMVEGPLYPNPFLTTVDWSREVMGQGAAGLLLEAIEGSGPAGGERVAEPRLLVRQSTAAPRS